MTKVPLTLCRSISALIVVFASYAVPTEGQISISGECGDVLCSSFVLMLSSSSPVSLSSLQFRSTEPGFILGDPAYVATDLSSGATISGSVSPVFPSPYFPLPFLLDFLADGGGLAIQPAFGSTISLVGARGPLTPTTAFLYSAVDSESASPIEGRFSVAGAAVLPEPPSLLLLAAGLLGLSWLHRRRVGRGADGLTGMQG
jgi:hypothetical protein